MKRIDKSYRVLPERLGHFVAYIPALEKIQAELLHESGRGGRVVDPYPLELDSAQNFNEEGNP